ncbi:MAG: ABC transporter ATP-binding protein [Chloroflexi bacterium]|nr:ABC transporter ATP-binding protein [Chloroflexota bacterium]
MTPVIQFERVSKKFSLDIDRPRSLQEIFVQRRLRAEADWFWALRDISFTIEPGEHVGLVGTNGSGKSTLLKLISRVIQPTTGAITTHGRVAGLLELGTGFHPDLTGRENIFLNASILGISRTAIKRQLDDIIDFADIGPFIDVQVRNYSSGMVVRLGFAITTALVPDVLLIDEVLAVGDADFQRKCITRLEDLKTQGVTLVFVSHGMTQVQQLCQRAIWISHGHVVADGEVEWVAGRYLDSVASAGTKRRTPEVTTSSSINRWGSYLAEVRIVEFLDQYGNCPRYFKTGEPLTVRIHYVSHTRIDHPTIGLAIYRHDGVHVTGPNATRDGTELAYIEGAGYIDYVLDYLPLTQGVYEFSAVIYDHDSIQAYDHQHRMFPLEVRAPGLKPDEGVVHFRADWRHTPGPDNRAA